MGLINDLGQGPIALDTCVFIYFIEENPDYLALVEPIFQAIDSGELSVVTSALTLLETLVVPYRLGNIDLAEEYEAILTQSRGLHLVELSLSVLQTAAALRATTRLRTPDALQIASAINHNCTAFVTNDRGHPNDTGLRVIQLKNYAGGKL